MVLKRDLDALIVGALQGDILHGYAIAQRIRATNEGALRPGEGMVYPVLYRLAADGVVRTEWLSAEGKPARKAYALNPANTGGRPTHRRRLGAPLTTPAPEVEGNG